MNSRDPMAGFYIIKTPQDHYPYKIKCIPNPDGESFTVTCTLTAYQRTYGSEDQG